MTVSRRSAVYGMTRRELLRAGLYGLGVGAALPLYLRRASALAAARELEGSPLGDPERILVVAELSGGNDGLNTVVPYGDDAYYTSRPTIGVPAAGLRKIDGHFGFHPSLKGFEELYKDGHLAIVHGCGYDKPSLSHFAAMGFWHTGAPNSGEKLGWVGRLADAVSPEPHENTIVNIATAQSLAVQSAVHAPLVFDEPERFARDHQYEQRALFAELTGVAGSGNASLDYLSGVARSAIDSAALVRQAWADYRTPVDYGLDLGFTRDLKKVAALIAAGLPTRFYYVSFRNNAFDTHVHQGDLHGRLLAYTADAVRGFAADMVRLGRGEQVAMMMFTEFGRRVEENASRGTDHGTATPMFVVGRAVRGGQYGAPPSLTDLRDGNLIYTTDFRRVYASMIREWMGYPDTAALLKDAFEPLGLFA